VRKGLKGWSKAEGKPQASGILGDYKSVNKSCLKDSYLCPASPEEKNLINQRKYMSAISAKDQK
jgi:hypothetical protein